MHCFLLLSHEKVVVKGNGKKKKKSRHITESSDSHACALPCLKCFCICNPKTQDIQKEKFQKGVQNQSCVLDVWLSYYMTTYIKPWIQTKLCAGRYLWWRSVLGIPVCFMCDLLLWMLLLESVWWCVKECFSNITFGFVGSLWWGYTFFRVATSVRQTFPS